jgi:membrane protein DedA with SNARE-associated domain
MAGYSWPKFLFWDLLGKLIWVVLYVMLGMLFSEHVQEIAGLAGDLTWAIVGIAAAAIMGWVLLKHKREDALHISKAEG